MNPGNQRRKRNPLTPEEVAEIIAFKKRREHERLTKFKKTGAYKFYNIFNLCCCFVYFELLFCFFGPCVYDQYKVEGVNVHYGNTYDSSGLPIVTDLEILANGKTYKLITKDFISEPPTGSILSIGSDFLLGKALKGVVSVSRRKYRLFSASPLVFFSGLALGMTCLAVIYNLNQNAYSLNAMSVLNGLVITGIFFIG
jgi:hypothetical protein